jgi:hypothetical protein
MISGHKTAKTCDNGSKQLDKKASVTTLTLGYKLNSSNLLLQH